MHDLHPCMPAVSELPLSHEASYWEAFYSTLPARQYPPSQFAAFVAGEILPGSFVVDIGCGSGRDSFFFASLGHKVLGIDGSEAAISACRKVKKEVGLELDFCLARLGTEDFSSIISAHSAFASCTSVTLYSRFFLHTIRPEEEAFLFRLLSAVKAEKQTLLALEFRTHRDEGQPKTTASHYRRFLNPMEVVHRLFVAGHKVAIPWTDTDWPNSGKTTRTLRAC